MFFRSLFNLRLIPQVGQLDAQKAALYRRALPIILQALLPALIFFVDRAMLGHYSLDALASMQISAAIVFTLLGIMGAFSYALLDTIRAKRPRAQAEMARGYLVMSLIVGATLSLLALCCLDGLVALFPRVSEQVILESKVYLETLMPALVIILFSIGGHAILQGLGAAKLAFRIACLATLLQIGLDFYLIPSLGTKGTALAAVFASLFQTLCLFVAIRYNPRLKLHFWSWGGEWDRLKELAREASSSMWERVVQYGGFFAQGVMISYLGTCSMAAQGALVAYTMISFVVADGLGVACLAYHQKSQLERACRGAAKMGTIILSSAALVMIIYSQGLMRLFSSDAQVISLGTTGLIIVAFTQPLSALAVIYADTLRAEGDRKIAAFGSIIGAVFVRLVAGYYFAFVCNLGLAGIWWAILLDWLVRVAIFVPVHLHRRFLYTHS